MTLKQFQKTYKKLLKSIMIDLTYDGTRLFNSGGIDTTKYEKDTFLLPKIIAQAAINNYRMALPEGGDKDIKNLCKF